MLGVAVQNMLQDKDRQMQLTVIAGKQGLAKKITIPRIQKPGLALTGDVSNLHPGRIQVLGKSENNYLNSLKITELKTVIKKICACDIACFVLTKNYQANNELIAACDQHGIPLFSTSLLTSTFVNRVTSFLNDSFAVSSNVHGVLLDVFGVGVLLKGESGIGKSECALDLVLRGHRLVADDIVHLKKQQPAKLFGTSSALAKHHMEIRGVGIINIRDIFGVSAVRDRKIIELVIELLEWDPKVEYDRLGIDEQRYTLLDVSLPHLQIPIRSGRNISAIIEVAVRNHLIKMGGQHTAKIFEAKLNKEILTNTEYANNKLDLLE